MFFGWIAGMIVGVLLSLAVGLIFTLDPALSFAIGMFLGVGCSTIGMMIGSEL